MKTSCFSFHFKEYMVNARLEVRPVFCSSIIDSSLYLIGSIVHLLVVWTWKAIAMVPFTYHNFQ